MGSPVKKISQNQRQAQQFIATREAKPGSQTLGPQRERERERERERRTRAPKPLGKFANSRKFCFEAECGKVPPRALDFLILAQKSQNSRSEITYFNNKRIVLSKNDQLSIF
jgi:hypothetical protein